MTKKMEEFEVEIDNQEKINIKEMSSLKKAFYFICGLESQINPNANDEIEKTTMDTSIDEDPFWSRFCDINAIIAMSLAGFSVAFFNKYY